MEASGDQADAEPEDEGCRLTRTWLTDLGNVDFFPPAGPGESNLTGPHYFAPPARLDDLVRAPEPHSDAPSGPSTAQGIPLPHGRSDFWNKFLPPPAGLDESVPITESSRGDAPSDLATVDDGPLRLSEPGLWGTFNPFGQLQGLRDAPVNFNYAGSSRNEPIVIDEHDGHDDDHRDPNLHQIGSRHGNPIVVDDSDDSRVEDDRHPEDILPRPLGKKALRRARRAEKLRAYLPFRPPTKRYNLRSRDPALPLDEYNRRPLKRRRDDSPEYEPPSDFELPPEQSRRQSTRLQEQDARFLLRSAKRILDETPDLDFLLEPRRSVSLPPELRIQDARVPPVSRPLKRKREEAVGSPVVLWPTGRRRVTNAPPPGPRSHLRPIEQLIPINQLRPIKQPKPRLQSEKQRQDVGFLGEIYVYERFKAILGNDWSYRNWTSCLRAQAGYPEFKDDGRNTDFTFLDVNGTMRAFLMTQGITQPTWSNLTTFHMEVKATLRDTLIGGSSGLSRNQTQMKAAINRDPYRAFLEVKVYDLEGGNGARWCIRRSGAWTPLVPLAPLSTN